MCLQVRLHLLAGLALLALASHPLLAQTRIIQPDHAYEQAFAIIIDTDSYAKATEAVHAYKRMLEETEQLSVYILVNNWESPSPLREEIIQLHSQNPGLEGVVFIGKIPIAMIRQGQHLTTAFKMDEDLYPFRESSVPSDRFYDDFDLIFDFIRQDELQPLHFYYRLSEHSPQRIRSDIYSGRIKPLYGEGKDPYRQLSDYLYKVIADRQSGNELNHLFSFLGHGSISGCHIAWASEIVALSEQFPHLGIPGNSQKFMKYNMDEDIKLRLMNELQREELDLAILTMHGSPGIQHLSAPLPMDYSPGVVQRLIHTMQQLMSQADNVSVMQLRAERLGIPMGWFQLISLPEDFVPDTLPMKRYEIDLDDMRDFHPNVRAIIFDACYNGAFQMDEYISGAYLFNEGKSIVSIANSVNVLQDIWPQEFLGLLGLGVRIGQIRQAVHTLESHIIGDPTFRFHAEGQVVLNQWMSANKDQPEAWEIFLQDVHPDLTAYALRMMSMDPPEGFSEMLFDMFSGSPHASIRLECLYLLKELNDYYYEQALIGATGDSYELIRRFGASWMRNKGHPAFIEVLVKMALHDPAYLRAGDFNAKMSLNLFHPDAVIEEIYRQTEQLPSSFVNGEAAKEALISWVESNRAWVEGQLALIMDKNLDKSRRIMPIRMLRNNNYHHLLSHYINLAKDQDEDEELRILMVEALGWFTHSIAKDRIIESCEEIIRSPRTPEAVRREAIKTLNRLRG
jgi:hypothetical protein